MRPDTLYTLNGIDKKTSTIIYNKVIKTKRQFTSTEYTEHGVSGIFCADPI